MTCRYCPTPPNWSRAAVLRPDNTRVVHHCLVFVGSDILDLGLSGFFAGYVPGANPAAYPVGTGKKLPPFFPLTFQRHYITTGQPETDQTHLGLSFASAPPAMELLTRSAYTTDITIAPGLREYEREALFTPSATKEVWLYEMSPHMRYHNQPTISDSEANPLKRPLLKPILRKFGREWARPVLVVLLVTSALRSALADWNDVPTGSMKPTIVLHHG